MTLQTNELTHMSLCAGYGGIDLGLTSALTHTKTVCYSEIEAYAIENLIAKMEAGFTRPCSYLDRLENLALAHVCRQSRYPLRRIPLSAF